MDDRAGLYAEHYGQPGVHVMEPLRVGGGRAAGGAGYGDEQGEAQHIPSRYADQHDQLSFYLAIRSVTFNAIDSNFVTPRQRK